MTSKELVDRSVDWIIKQAAREYPNEKKYSGMNWLGNTECLNERQRKSVRRKLEKKGYYQAVRW